MKIINVVLNKNEIQALKELLRFEMIFQVSSKVTKNNVEAVKKVMGLIAQFDSYRKFDDKLKKYAQLPDKDSEIIMDEEEADLYYNLITITTKLQLPKDTNNKVTPYLLVLEKKFAQSIDAAITEESPNTEQFAPNYLNFKGLA